MVPARRRSELGGVDCRARMDFKLELIPVPVSDVDRAKAFYAEGAGFAVDNDVTVREGLRFIQLPPPGSACSISIGEGITEMEPGSLQGLQLVVENVEAARDELVGGASRYPTSKTSRGAGSCSSATPTATA